MTDRTNGGAPRTKRGAPLSSGIDRKNHCTERRRSTSSYIAILSVSKKGGEVNGVGGAK